MGQTREREKGSARAIDAARLANVDRARCMPRAILGKIQDALADCAEVLSQQPGDAFALAGRRRRVLHWSVE